MKAITMVNIAGYAGVFGCSLALHAWGLAILSLTSIALSFTLGLIQVTPAAPPAK